MGKTKNRKELIFRIVLCAIMAALSIVLDKVSVNVERFKITFYALPLIVVGITNGISYGLIAGAVSGLVLQLTSPYGVGPTSVFWALAPIAWGGVSAVIYHLFKKKINNRFILYTLSIVIASVVANVLNTFAMYMDSLLVKDSYYTLATILVGWPLRLVIMVISWVPYIVITGSVCEALSKAFGFNEQEKEEEKTNKLNFISLYTLILSYTVNIFLIIEIINIMHKDNWVKAYYPLVISIINLLISILSFALEIIFIKKNIKTLEGKKKTINIILFILEIVLISLSLFTFIRCLML